MAAAPAPENTTRTSAMSLARDLQRVEQGRPGDDRGAVLVVVEDGDPERPAERLLDVEALRRLDVLQVDAPDGRLEELAEPDDVLGVLGADLEVEHVEVRELLEEVALALHHRLAGERPDVAQAEHRRAVGDHRHQVPLGRVLVGVVGVGLDLEAGLGDPGGVGQCEVPLVGQGLGGNDGDLPGAATGMVFEGILSLHWRPGCGWGSTS
jgi:hypothetical protein